MKLFRSIVELQNELFEVRKQGKTVGLVPTMGALHGGHASLVKRSVAENGVTVVSVFLNPTQFNDKNDLDRYPRTLDADCELLESCGADYVFAPSVSEMYPQEDRRTFSLSFRYVSNGGSTPTRTFQWSMPGCITSFYIVRPDNAYFGEKDWQQIAVIKAMVADLGLNVHIVECPTIREADGLAKSSRNTLLKDDERTIAPKIYEALTASKKVR